MADQLLVFEVHHEGVAIGKGVMQTATIGGANDPLVRQPGPLLEYAGVLLTEDSAGQIESQSVSIFILFCVVLFYSTLISSRQYQ